MARATKAPKASAQAEEFRGLSDIIGDIMESSGVEENLDVDRPSPTGIDVLDYYNGRYFFNHRTGQYELHIGIPRGKMIGVVGNTGSYKTTLAVQMGMSIVVPYEDGTCYHVDLERAWSKERTADITQLPMEVVNRKYHRTKPLSVQKIYSWTKKMINAKVAEAAKNPRIWTVDVGTGERVMVPTVQILDTVVALQTDDTLDEKEDMGSVLAEPGVQAKMNNMLAQRLAGSIADGNITLIWVNHIRSEIQTGPTPTAKRYQHMAKGETIPGGNGFPQMADLLLKLRGEELLKEGEKFKIQGSIIRATVIKSRLSYAGRSFQLVATDTGIDNDWTNLNFLINEKAVKGGGSAYFFADSNGVETRRFAYSQFKRFVAEDAEFRRIVSEVLVDRLTALVPLPNSADEAALIEEGQAVLAAEAVEVVE